MSTPISPSRVGTLRQNLIRIGSGAAASIIFGAVATNILRIVSSVTLTRILDAHAYGVVGVITSIAYILSMLSDVGLFDFIVRHEQGEEESFLDEIWTLRAIRGVGLALVMMAVAHPVSVLLGKPELGPVIAVWSLSFVLDGFSSLAFATGVRSQMLWRLSLIDFSMNLAQFVVSLTFALILRSYWALVAAMLAGATLKMILSYAVFPRPRRRLAFSRARSRELWRFSRYIALSSFLSLLILQSDKLVLARLMPLAEYGLYAIATTLAVAPGAIAGPYASRVLLDTYSKTVRGSAAQLKRVLYEKRRNFTLIYMFSIGGMIGTAPLIVAILYDPRYQGVALYLQFLAIGPLLNLSSLAANQALLALGWTGGNLLANICRIVWLVVGGAIAIVDHNILLLVAVVGTGELPGMICFWIILHRKQLLSLRQEFLGFAAAGAGFCVGWAIVRLVFAVFGRL